MKENVVLISEYGVTWVGLDSWVC